MTERQAAAMVAVYAECDRFGLAGMAAEIEVRVQAIIRPRRALGSHEAVAMVAAWRSGYRALGVPICSASDGGFGTCPIAATCREVPDGHVGCVPNFDSEMAAAKAVEMLQRSPR